MTGFLTAIAFIIIFSILVLVHEWGHFYFARRAKIKIEEFGFGLPPRAKKLFKDKKGTVFSLNWIPFGGFVKMFGEDSTDKQSLKHPDSYASKSVWQKFLVVIAGVTMNFLTAVLLLTFAYTVGVTPFLMSEKDIQSQEKAGNIVLDYKVLVGDVLPNKPAEEAGFQKGDLILKINNIPVLTPEDVIATQTPATKLTYEIQRGEESLLLSLKTDEDGKIGVALGADISLLEIKPIRYPFYQAPWEALKTSLILGGKTVQMFGDLLVKLMTQFSMPQGVAGPVGIVQMTHQIVEGGKIMELVKFTALLSISLAVINILPFPALDGGRLAFLIYEAIARKKTSPKIEATIHGIGYLFLMGLILLVTWNDFDRWLNFSGIWESILNLF